jgi:hypothetical protein
MKKESKIDCMIGRRWKGSTIPSPTITIDCSWWDWTHFEKPNARLIDDEKGQQFLHQRSPLTVLDGTERISKNQTHAIPQLFGVDSDRRVPKICVGIVHRFAAGMILAQPIEAMRWFSAVLVRSEIEFREKNHEPRTTNDSRFFEHRFEARKKKRCTVLRR